MGKKTQQPPPGGRTNAAPKQTEGGLKNRLLLYIASRFQGRLVAFRNNTGMGWAGTVVDKTADTITLKNPRPLHAGLVTGGSDMIGWTTVEITAEMVGRRVAVFTALELKTGRAKATEEQQNFIDRVRKAGGFAGVARYEGDIDATVNPHLL